MSKRIIKKILPEYFELIQAGKKKFEFRVADFELAEGDILVLEEWDSLDTATRKRTGRVIEKEVAFVKRLRLDEFKQREELETHGFYILQFE